MYHRLLTVAAVAVAAACASGGQGDDGNRISVVVENEYPSTVTAYAVWETGTRIRLGDVSRNRTRTFSTPRRGERVALGVEVVGSPPGATTAGPTRFRGGAGADPSAPFFLSEGILVSVGEGIEWQIQSSGTLVYRRLPPST